MPALREVSSRARPLIAVVGGTATSTTNAALVEAWRLQGIAAAWLEPRALPLLAAGDLVVARLDVRPTLDGVEPGLLELLALLHRGVRVVNPPGALLRAHDKLRTARRLAAANVPHPETSWLPPTGARSPLPPPLVMKPRFGSWGADVVRCDGPADVSAALGTISGRAWFRRQGAVVQRLVPPRGHDLRLIVAGGKVVGAIRRRARPGEWRTNFSLGGTLEPVVPPERARALAVAAAAAVGADFVGVDLLPAGGDYLVLEVNGAADFHPNYALPGTDVYAAAAEALCLMSFAPQAV
jgi:tetrahydromethanopterin:alpha-L-glutamate ligase